MKCLIIVYSYHHNNTDKIARVFAKSLDAKLKVPKEVQLEELKEHDLIGFGSGIYGAKNHKDMLAFVDALPTLSEKRAFIFSTAALTGKKKMYDDHRKLREKLQSKGFLIVSEFQCKGFNTNSFMKYFGGMNKGRPNADDLKKVEEFANMLKKK